MYFRSPILLLPDPRKFTLISCTLYVVDINICMQCVLYITLHIIKNEQFKASRSICTEGLQCFGFRGQDINNLRFFRIFSTPSHFLNIKFDIGSNKDLKTQKCDPLTGQSKGHGFRVPVTACTPLANFQPGLIIERAFQLYCTTSNMAIFIKCENCRHCRHCKSISKISSVIVKNKLKNKFVFDQYQACFYKSGSL